jgi:cell division protein FtsQ
VKALYELLQPLFEPLGASLQRLELTAQGGWQAQLDNGARLELGRGEPEELLARVARFVQTLTQVTQQHGRRLEAADLRYPSAYAVRLHGVTTGELPKTTRAVKTAVTRR